MIIKYLFSFAFFGLMAHIIYFMIVDSDEAITNSFNPRQEIIASRTYRGSIFASDGEVLATTELDDKDFETRSYPYNNLFSHTIGYATNGRMGVEKITNAQLLSSDIFIGEKVQNDLLNKKNPGNNITTTFDIELQQVALKSLGSYKGAIVVLEPKTGEIKAMVSTPDFDPNQIDAIWDDLLEDEDSSILLNRTTQGLYPPGSIFKMVTVLEYIRQNPDTYEDYSYECNGKHIVEGERINCFNGVNHGRVDIMDSVAKSCNAYLANIGLTLDLNSYQETLEELLFNQDLPLDLPFQKSSFVLEENASIIEIMQTVIGQGETQVTPMHMAMITAAIANDGILMTPYMIDNVADATGKIVTQYKPEEFSTIMTEEEANILKDMMTNVVENGTGSKLSGLDYSAGCKTGSAEYSQNKDDSHSWSIAFAPAEEPELVISIIMEKAGTGTSFAVPIVKRIFDAYFEN